MIQLDQLAVLAAQQQSQPSLNNKYKRVEVRCWRRFLFCSRSAFEYASGV